MIHKVGGDASHGPIIYGGCAYAYIAWIRPVLFYVRDVTCVLSRNG